MMDEKLKTLLPVIGRALEENGLQEHDLSIGCVCEAIPSLLYTDGLYEVVFQKTDGFLMLRTFSNPDRAIAFAIKAARAAAQKRNEASSRADLPENLPEQTEEEKAAGRV